MKEPVFVLALMGISPGVITELLWHLVVREQRRVVGVEIWTTAHVDPFQGAVSRHIDRLVEMDRSLRQTLGASARDLPRLAESPRGVPSRKELPTNEIRIVGFQDRDGGWLADVTDDKAAVCVAEQLHHRLGELTAALGPVGLVGSVAGGRKTMSASLQTAFALHARPQDRLVHVLLHPAIEQDRELLATYAVPTGPVHGIPPERQIGVHEVAFPRLQWLCPDLAERLAQMPYDRLCQSLQMSEATRAEVSSVGATSGKLELFCGEIELTSLRLKPHQFRAYRLLAERRGPIGQDALKRAVDALVYGSDCEIARVLERFSARMRSHPLSRAIERFIPVRKGGAWSIPGAADVVVG